ncbi:cellulose biosynthesis cyclic di-GMP-binding regulatory protein BcsB [Photobacterium sp. SDRW27]|uniref:cellulose biosynthesis cyclic di-GMP-binding regulatory protein BcsB n=1 Tax=Photobacterium obscurum TaxID=2829490 RepID=UPI002243699B|nr:cellulose biosynthesis cyclic di-GMP-binding regulatory protein BcsB [Photobacterium obscurum]MCW8329959.1 cellulose biosynthesis cyclic di-GMP-binding regulatory protein BcsB [Photobacterium obscurum]
MKQLSIKILTFIIALLFTCLATAQQPTQQAFSVVDRKEITFSQLGINGSIMMQGSESSAYLSFGSRLDEIISKASLDFSFIPSPALLAAVSHLKVYLNDELMGVIAIADGDQGKRVSASLPLDPRFISNFNQLRFELIGSINSICRDPNDPSIWAEISNAGRVRLQVQKSILATDLALLPAPFFDERDFSHVTLPFVFPGQQNIGELTAAGVLASYFGALANWRGVNFPVYIDELPQQHAIVFATNQNKPAFIRDLPDVTGPTLQLITHPTNEYIKLLLVLGRDSEDLNMAVRGLVLGKSLLTGPVAQINSVTDLKPRQPYDAPNWVRTDRPVSFAELVDGPYQLQAEGRTSSPINVTFNLPPDLFAWQSRGIPLDLGYRYSPPRENSGSRLNFSVNGQFVEAFNLTEKGRNSDDKRLRIPLLDDTLLSTNSSSHIPAFRIDSSNTMQFEFSFASESTDICQSAQPSRYYAVMDSDSTLDFSGFPHYIKMPNLRAFAKSGFPFSKMADLSETAVVIKQHPSVAEVALLLDTMGLIGAKTGYPALKVTMVDRWVPELLADKDILTIGTLSSQAEDVGSKEGAKLILSEMTRQLALPVNNNKLGWASWLKSQPGDSNVTGVVDVTAAGAFASMVAMESPFTKKRSLISLVASSSDDFSLIGDALNERGKSAHMFGSVVTIKAAEITSFEVGDTYHLGKLPVIDLIWYHFSEHPVLLALCAALLVISLTILIWRVLSRLSAQRLAVGDDK